MKCFSMIKNTKALFYVGDQKTHCVSCYTLSSGQSHSNIPSEMNEPRTSVRRFVFLDVIRFFLVLNVCVDHMVMYYFFTTIEKSYNLFCLYSVSLHSFYELSRLQENFKFSHHEGVLLQQILLRS